MSSIKQAVVVGINDYGDDKIENLSGAVNDATEVRDLLRMGKFTIDDKHFLTNEKATCDRMRAAISDLFWKTEECDIALFYFSGHGRRDHLEHGYLLPHDADHAAPFVRGIGIQELKQLFLRAEPKNSCIMILDCCYSGVATRAEKGGLENTDHIKSFVEELSLKDMKSKGGGRFILASAGAEKTAREEALKHALGRDRSADGVASLEQALGGHKHAHGVFSFHLIEALRGGPRDQFGQISLGALRTHLQRVLGDDHKPHFSADDETSIDKIILATAEEDMQTQIEGHLRKIGKFLEVAHPRTVMGAMRLLNELDRLGVKLKEIDDYCDHVDRFLSDRKPEVYRWWYNNNLKILEETEQSSLLDSLQDILRNIDRRTISRLTTTNMNLVVRVMEEVESDKNDPDNQGYRRIANDIRLLEREASSPPDRQAKSALPGKANVKVPRATAPRDG